MTDLHSSATVADAPTGESRISVCHVVSGDLWAGAEVQVATLLRALSRRPDVMLSALLLNEGRLARELRECAVDVTVVAEGEHGIFSLASHAARRLAGRPIDVLHSHRYKENLLAYLVARRCSVPVLVRTQHGLPEPGAVRKLPKRLLLRAIDIALARYATDRVISVSGELASHLARDFGRRKVVTIQNGLDMDKVASLLTKAEAKQRLGVQPEHPFVGCVGRLEPVKRFDLFLQMAGALASRIPESRFAVVGEGRQKQYLTDLAASLGLGDRVQFLGHRDDVYDVLRALDVFVLCSDHEGLPMTLLEAMCLGVPVVARDVGGIAEVVENGVSGILLSSASPEALSAACERLLLHTTDRAQLAIAARARVESSFNVAATAEKLIALYRSLLHSSA